MTDAALKAAVIEGLRQVAPESDPDRLGPGDPVREELGIDSYDFFTFLVTLHKTLGVEIPESDYGKLTTIDAMIEYLRPRV